MKYSLIRLALFVPLFVLFSFLQLGTLLAALCAGLIAFAISYLFFQKQRDAATATLHERFSGRAKPIRSAGEIDDANAEDSLVDANPDITVRSEVPRTATPRSEVPRTEVPRTETSSTEVPRTETSSTEVPRTETPSKDS